MIPCFNSELTVESAINSAIFQTYKPFEIIIVDDASKDKTTEIVRGLIDKFHNNVAIKLVISSVNQGPGISRNIGWDSARGDFVAFLDSDDQWDCNKLKTLSHLISVFPRIEVVGHSNSVSELFRFKTVSYYYLVFRNFTITPNLIVKRLIETRYSSTIRYAEDHDFVIRLAEKYSVFFLDGVNIPTTLGRVPLTVGGLSGHRLSMRLGEIAMYFNIIKRNKFMILLLIVILPVFLLKICKDVYRALSS